MTLFLNDNFRGQRAFGQLLTMQKHYSLYVGHDTKCGNLLADCLKQNPKLGVLINGSVTPLKHGST